MFAGAQIVTTKLVPASKRQQIVNEQNEDKTIQDLVNVTVMVPRTKAVIDVESPAEKFERKVLAHERKNERALEQKQLTQHMENLMEKVLHDTPLSNNDEVNLRNKIKNIVTKVNKQTDRIDSTSLHPSVATERSSSSSLSSRIKPDSIEQTLQNNPQPKSSKAENQRAFLLWSDKNIR